MKSFRDEAETWNIIGCNAAFNTSTKLLIDGVIGCKGPITKPCVGPPTQPPDMCFQSP